MYEKALILSLITDDLINQKLINNFHRMGIDAGDYQLSIGHTIFSIMGIEILPKDESFDQYMIMAEGSNDIPVDSRVNFQPLAEKIYLYLCTLPKESTSN